MEMIMSTATSTMAALAASIFANAAHASQGPGIANGTMGATAQLAMALIVYGGSALLIAWGLIGAVRHRQ